MRPERQGAYEGCIPGRHVRGAVMHYYFEAVNAAGRRAAVSNLFVMTLSTAPPVLAKGASKVCRGSSRRSVRATRVKLSHNVARANVLALAERTNHQADRLYRAAIIVAVVGVVVASFPLAGFAAGPDVKGMIGVLVVSGTGGLGVLTGCGLAIGAAVYRSRARRLLSTLAMSPPRTTVFRWGFRF